MILALPARAKLNLELEVLRRREDGFHDIRTTFQEIELHDLLEFEPAAKTTFTSEGFSVDGNDNSVLKAGQALENAAGRTLHAKIHLHKRIPPGSGMGGASSDAATTLKALKTMYSLENDLAPVAKGIGSDVPFFLIGGRARGEGRGEILTPLTPTNHWYAIAWPGLELSTPAVYRAWDDVKGDLQRAAEHSEPRLNAFAQSLGPGWRMTGSGSAFFTATDTEEEARLAVANLDCWTAVTR
ncbi:MAG TPA: 4-(cytidine 5'-diphospho)-2-C-methyl-D-erythritol kinase [Candidatus Dormibacteraeota bacterium]|nr:4-(cytidine 5'-diphospho)-2-C-methyl-D-erythritol kinase [Candidatus Dormibacteraeota bacterium]